ncbi:MAG: hypothetical protein WBX23_07550 [Candidatus Cybelea sp.]
MIGRVGSSRCFALRLSDEARALRASSSSGIISGGAALDVEVLIVTRHGFPQFLIAGLRPNGF